jgi:hypothetical protein
MVMSSSPSMLTNIPFSTAIALTVWISMPSLRLSNTMSAGCTLACPCKRARHNKSS